MELSIAQLKVQEADSNTFSVGSDDDDSYIEIVLDDAPPPSEYQIVNLDSNTISTDAECDDDDDDEDCHELRISISSTINPIPLIHHSHAASVDSPQTHTSVPSISSSSNSSDLLPTTTFSEKYYCTAEYSPPTPPLQLPSAPKPGLLSSSVNRLFNLRVLFSDNHPRQETMLQNDIPSINPYNTRTQPSINTKPANGGSVMKLLIKFRATKIRALIASLVKPNKGRSKCKTKILQRYNNQSDGNGRDNYEGIRSSCLYWDSEPEINTCEPSFRKSRSRRGGGGGGGVVEIDLGALNLRGIFNMARKGSSRRTSNWSTSASPLREEFSLYSTSTDNSIQAAIAYCKTSSDFSF